MPHAPIPVVVPPGGGLRLTGIGDVMIPKVAAAQSGGSVLVAEYIAMPGAGPPMHVHSREDETFWVLEGEVWFAVGDQRERVTPGGVVFGARGTPHTFRNCSGQPARMMLVVTPGDNFERFFGAMLAPGADGSPPSDSEIVQRIVAIAPRYGMTILGPNPFEDQ